MESCKDKNGKFESQYDKIHYVLGDLEKGVDQLIQTCATIARQRPPSAPKPAETVEGTKEDEERPPHPSSASTKNKLDRLRQLIEFTLPTDTIGAHGVTEGTLVQYLGMIEQKANELLTLNYLFNSPKKLLALAGMDGSPGLSSSGTENILSTLIPSGGVAGLLGPGPTAPIGTLSIVPPSTG